MSAVILKALFIFPGEYHLVGPEEPIEAQVGSNVVLPCLVKPPVNLRDGTVEWMFDSSKTVHLFRNEGDDRESQDKSYKDRTYLNHAMLELGDISLKLSNITKNDEGIYSCLVQRLPDLSEERHVTLIVVDGKENENPEGHSGGPEPGVIVGLVVAALIILAFIIYCAVRRHRGEQIFPCWNNKSQKEQRRNYGDHRGNGNQGDGAEERPLQDLEQPNQNVRIIHHDLKSLHFCHY
uniref:Myelin-oligodendrocyte glycoprotein-like n=1 Tax=Xiphophorus maculatus TaxID=8083 RepID=A0A3B5R1S3_XIPMA